MKKIVFLFSFLLSLSVLQAQVRGPFKLGIGVKAGLNFANISNASSINNSSRTGFHFGAFFSPGSPKLIGYRGELIFSRQGYDFKKGTTSGSVNLDYIMLPQMITLNFGKRIQLQAGGQISFLINGKSDTIVGPGPPPPPPVQQVKDYFNRVDFGLAGGLEINAYRGLFIGARYNVSLNNAFKDIGTGPQPSFVPNINQVDAKNNLVQLYLGYKF
jgi:Outer membrane protein beta-barrel domain